MFFSQPFKWLAGLPKIWNILSEKILEYPEPFTWLERFLRCIGYSLRTFMLWLVFDRADLKKILFDVAESTLRKIFSTKKETRSILHRLTWSDGLEENTFWHRHIRGSCLGNCFPEKGNFYFYDFTDWNRVVLVFLHQSCVGLVGLYLYLYSMLAQYILSLIGVESVFLIIRWACIWICRICLHRIHCFSSV